MYLRSIMAILAIYIYIYIISGGFFLGAWWFTSSFWEIQWKNADHSFFIIYRIDRSLVGFSVLRSIADSSRHIFAFFFRIPSVYTQMLQG